MERTLEEEVKHAAAAARATAMANGNMLPMLHVFGMKDGQEICAICAIQCNMGNTVEARGAAFRQLGAMSQGAVGELAYLVHIEEGYMRTAGPDGEPDERTKKEVLSVIGTDTQGQQHAILFEMVRDELGVLIDLPQLRQHPLGRVHLDINPASAYIEGYTAADPSAYITDARLAALQYTPEGKSMGRLHPNLPFSTTPTPDFADFD